MEFSRRDLLKSSLATAGLLSLGGCAPYQSTRPTRPFLFCLNTSTISGQKLGILDQLQVTADAGYDGIEIWVRDVQHFLKEGGQLADIKQKAQDLNLNIESAISFPRWIVDDESVRSAALEQMRQDVDMLAQIGCPRIAAPPVGASQEPGLNLDAAASRFYDICAVGEETGVVPQLELWGFSANLSRIGEVMYVLSESGYPNAKTILDAYHIYKGGSPFTGLSVLSKSASDMFHMNDYPADPPRDTIKDADRIMPGDGVAPFDVILPVLRNEEKPMILSLELFNHEYWQQDALQVAKIGLEKMQAVVNRVFEAKSG